jgi:DNA uptake protein ComE-like DNA-binding protein
MNLSSENPPLAPPGRGTGELGRSMFPSWEGLARIFHRLVTRIIRLSLTPCFSWVWKCREPENRFNGLVRSAETVETVPTSSGFIHTQLKQGVNEKFFESQSRAYEAYGLGAGPRRQRRRVGSWVEDSNNCFREFSLDCCVLLPSAVGRWPGARERGSVLIIVLWVAFGLVSLALYFAHSMSLELRAADNRVAGLEAEQAIAGAARYVSNVLANAQPPGALPATNTYLCAAVPVGNAFFWLIARDTNVWQSGPYQPLFGLVDEASKLNLNTATLEMLEALPRMTPELAASIISWRSAANNGSNTNGGAQSDTYMRLQPPYLCKNAPFESVDELRLVLNMDLETLYGEDANLNGVLDPNENDGDISPPYDDRNGRLDPGILEYVTVYSREPSISTNGTARINISTAAGLTQLRTLLQQQFGMQRANQIRVAVANSLLQFYMTSGMTAAEFAQIESNIRGASLQGLINVNTASQVVLASIPGIGTDNASALVAYRQSNSSLLSSVAWVAEVLDRRSALQAGPYLTSRSYQFLADIAALGHYGRGYQRVKYIFDTSEGLPKIAYRQDISHLGWALGKNVRTALLLAKTTR